MYLAKSRYDHTAYFVKKLLTRGLSPDRVKFFLKESDTLEKLNKFNHPNLQYLTTWFIDKYDYIIMVIEYREGKTLKNVFEEQVNDGKLMETETVVHILS